MDEELSFLTPTDTPNQFSKLSIILQLLEPSQKRFFKLSDPETNKRNNIYYGHI